MIDEILAVGSTFDWISPTLAIVNDLAQGPSHTFIIPHDCGWSGYEVRDLLAKFDVESWGLMIITGYITISVLRHRAGWAQTILARHGIPVNNPVPAAPPTSAVERDGRVPSDETAPANADRRSNVKDESGLDRMTVQLERFSWFRSLEERFSDYED